MEDNPQLKYYAFGFIEADGADIHPDDEVVTLTIVQPRVPWHPDGVIRSWDTTAGELRKWAYDELLPAMQAAERKDGGFQLGDWCRFCPAKLLCPAMREAVDTAVSGIQRIEAATVDELSEEQIAWYLGVWPGGLH